MSLLVIVLPPRERLASRRGDASASSGAGARAPLEYDHVFSTDGRSVAAAGRSAPAQWPRADRVVAVLHAADVSWHRIDIPKAPPARLRAALVGVMEEALLDDDEALHFALAVGAVPGTRGWVAVVHKPWLQAVLQSIEAGGVIVERLVASAQPGDAARGHFFAGPGGDDGDAMLAWSGPDGATCMRLAGALVRALLPPADAPTPTRWTATPPAAAAAERWLGAPVALLTEGERALEAAAVPGSLRQFDLALRTRGTRAVRDALRRVGSAEWRPVRIGLAALVAVQVLGLNLDAWRQGRELAARRGAMAQLLRDTHPGVRTVLDPPLQMQAETERLRAAAGRPGDADLEVLLAAAASAWPDGQGPLQVLRYESGKLTLSAPGFGEAQFAQFRQRLAGSGFAAAFTDGQLNITRATTA